MTDLRARLRTVPTLTGSPPPFDPEATPAEPHALFVDSLLAAVDAEVAEQLNAALTFYWVPLARQVRVSGTVVPADPADSARDFLARPVKARAEALVGKQSQRLDRLADIEEAVAPDRRRPAPVEALAVTPFVGPSWSQGPDEGRHAG